MALCTISTSTCTEKLVHSNQRAVQFDASMGSLSANDQKLMDCAYDGTLQEVRKLLRAGANVNAQQNDGRTALMIASQNGHTVLYHVGIALHKCPVQRSVTDFEFTILRNWHIQQSGCSSSIPRCPKY